MTEDSPDGKEPVSGLSAASSCIRLSLTAPKATTSAPSPLLSFRPVYTHQCFAGEYIEGWRPLLEAEHQSRLIYRSWKGDFGVDVIDGVERDGDIHKSYLTCPCGKQNAERIDAHIILSPSCDECRIEIQTNINDEGADPLPKKAKTVSFQVAEPDAQQKKMSIHDILLNLSLAVPPIASVSMNGVDRLDLIPTDKDTKHCNSSGYLSKPLGNVIKTYHRTVKGSNTSSGDEARFILTLADGSDSEVAEYHNSIQPLARWFIETADDVDLADASRGYWKVMYLFRYLDTPSCQSSTLGLAGYFTLLHIKSPFRKPRPGVIVRVCQAMILPPYHRAGHGSEMLQSIHDYAEKTILDASSGTEIVEINVEDPAPAFVALRDAVDYHRFISPEKDWMNYLPEHDVTKKDFFDVSEESLLSVAASMRVTKRQALTMHQLWKLQHIMSWKKSFSPDVKSNSDNNLIQDVETKYRLMVKKSLKALRQEELGACPSGKEGQKILLGRWFDETMCHYQRILLTTSPTN